MKAIKIENEDLYCRYEDAIYFDNDSFSLINGDFENGYIVDNQDDIEELLIKEPKGWTSLETIFEVKSNNFLAICGETSFGGAGFIALKRVTDSSFKWIIHLSTMNNPTNLKIDRFTVYVTTDLNFPNGVDFIVPIENPRSFKVKTRD